MRTIALIAGEPGVELTAEGIETEARLARLRELDCTPGQGSCFARPVPVRRFRRLLDGRTLPAGS